MPYTFSDACASFEKNLLGPALSLARGAPFLAAYVAFAITDTLAGAHLSLVQRVVANDYTDFIDVFFPPVYRPHKSSLYYVGRCGLLHGSRLDTGAATPPKGTIIHPIELRSEPAEPIMQNGHLLVSVTHYLASLHDAFDQFRLKPPTAAVNNFPLRFDLTIVPYNIMVAGTSGISTITIYATAGP